MAAMRHMHQYGTTSAQLAWIRVAASKHAQHNPNALLRDVVTVEDVISSPMIADPLHRLDCCVITDGGGAIVVTKPEIARTLKRPLVKVLGAGEAPKHQLGGKIDLTYSGAVWSGPAAFAEAGVSHGDIKYVSIYDSFTITVLITLEDLGFAAKGQGGKLVADGNLISGTGKLPFNTDGGGLCNNHPANRGGLTKVVEAVRQLRGGAQPHGQGKKRGPAPPPGTRGAPGPPARRAPPHLGGGGGVSSAGGGGPAGADVHARLNPALPLECRPQLIADRLRRPRPHALDRVRARRQRGILMRRGSMASWRPSGERVKRSSTVPIQTVLPLPGVVNRQRTIRVLEEVGW